MALHQELCGRCGKEVYYAEKKVAINKVWHHYCFNCVVCHKALNANNFSTYRSEIYCQQCYLEATLYEFGFSGSKRDSGLLTPSSRKSRQSSQTSHKHSRMRRSEILESSNLRPSEIKNALRNRKSGKIEETDPTSGRNNKNNSEEKPPHEDLSKGDTEEILCKTVFSSFPSKYEKDKTRSKSPDRSHDPQKYTSNEEEEDSAYETEHMTSKFTVFQKILPSFLCKGDNCSVPKNAAYSELVYEDAGGSSPKKEDNNRKYNILKRLNIHNNEEKHVNNISGTPKCDKLSSRKHKEETLFISKSGNTKIVKITSSKIKKNENIVEPNKHYHRSKGDAKLNSKKLESSPVPKETSIFSKFWKKLEIKPVEQPKNSLENPVKIKQASSNDLIRVRSCMKKTRVSTDNLNIDTFKTHTKTDSKDHIKHESIKKPNKTNARQSVASITTNHEKKRGKYILLTTCNIEASNYKSVKREANQKEKEKSNSSLKKSSSQIKKTLYDRAVDKWNEDRQNKSKSNLEELKKSIEPKILNPCITSNLNEMKKPKDKKEDFYCSIPYSSPKRNHKEEMKKEDNTKENIYKEALKPNKKEVKSRDRHDNHKKKEDRNEEWKLCKYPVYMYAQTNDKSTKKKNSKEDLPKTALPKKKGFFNFSLNDYSYLHAGGLPEKTKPSQDKTKQLEDTVKKDPKTNPDLQSKKEKKGKKSDNELFTTAYSIYPRVIDNRNIRCQTSKSLNMSTKGRINEENLFPTVKPSKKRHKSDDEASVNEYASKNISKRDSVQIIKKPCVYNNSERRKPDFEDDVSQTKQSKSRRNIEKCVTKDISSKTSKLLHNSLKNKDKIEDQCPSSFETNTLHNIDENKESVRNRFKSNFQNHNEDLKFQRERSGGCSTGEMLSKKPVLGSQKPNFNKLVKHRDRLYNSAKTIEKLWEGSMPILKEELNKELCTEYNKKRGSPPVKRRDRQCNSARTDTRTWQGSMPVIKEELSGGICHEYNKNVKQPSERTARSGFLYHPSSFHEMMRAGNRIYNNNKKMQTNVKDSMSTQKDAGSKEHCRRCGRKVYFVERKNAENGVYHNNCYSCYVCHRHLNSVNIVPRQGEIFCKQCHMKHFGPQTYGFGINSNLH